MSRKKIIITVISITLGCGLILFVVLSVLIYRSFISPILAMREVPPELREPRVITGAGVLVKSEFYRVGKETSWRDLLDDEKIKSWLDSVQDMKVGQLDGQGGLDVGLAGRFGVTLLDRQGNVTKRTNFRFEMGKSRLGNLANDREKDSFYNKRLLDVEGDGVCEVLAFGGLDGMALFDHQGNVLFSRGELEQGKSSIHEVSAGDVDGDGVTEFIASWDYEPWEGLELLDRNGNSKWRHEEESKPGEIEVVDVNADGKADLVEDDGGELKIRDNQGQIKDVVNMPVYLSHLSLIPQTNNQRPPQNLAVREGSLWLIDLDGKNYTKYDAPLSKIKLSKPRVVGVPGFPSSQYTYETEEVYHAKGVWVELEKDRPKYLAVIANFTVMDRSLFYLYDSQGKLIYQEILPEECDAVAVLPPENNDGRDKILVSGQKTVWRYATH